MKTMKIHLKIFLGLCLLAAQLSCEKREQQRDLVIDNGKLKLGFNKDNGALIIFKDLVNNYEFLDEKMTTELPWEINFQQSEDSIHKDGITPLDFTYSRPDSLTLILKWSNFKEIGNEDLQITAKITLDKEKSFSYWNISLNGIQGNLINSVVFPKIKGIKDMEQEKLAVPKWMGELLDNPRGSLAKSKKEEKKIELEYPGPLSLQCVALYNPDKIGLYAAANDTLAYRKSFSFILDKSDNLTYQMSNYPAFDSTANSYEPSYAAVIGSFTGDWITAAEQYREWGSRQKWSSKSRFKQGLNPKWLEETALWVWNRGRSENVLLPAADLKQRLGLPVNVFWHWWHGCSYDEGFPEYLPPREGKESFIDAMKSAQNKGIRSIVYMNSFQWGDSTDSWETENASVHAVKDINGDLRSHVYNIFTGNSLTNMCMATPFWKDTYTALSDSVVNEYGTNGVYMDQACLNKVCYDANHGHTLGGGNYWMKNFGKLTEQIRSKISGDNNPILAGEGGGESWMPYLDLFLTLQVSRERYAGIGEWETIPFFQAVYHQYAITYGNYSSLVTPPYDELWPKEFAPKNQEQPLDPIFNKQFLMEQARSFVWGMQPTISNYHSFLASNRKAEIDYLMDIARVRYKGLKYMLYGQFLRAPDMEVPQEELDISKLSIYAGRKGKSVTAFKKKYPLVYSGAWKADDGSIGIPLTSISENDIPINFTINSKDYKLRDSGKVFITTNEGKKLLYSYKGGKIHVEYKLRPREVCLFEIIPES
jgi:hypothetical protein